MHLIRLLKQVLPESLKCDYIRDAVAPGKQTDPEKRVSPKSIKQLGKHSFKSTRSEGFEPPTDVVPETTALSD